MKGTYKALQVKELTKDFTTGIEKLELTSVSSSKLGENEVRIKVKAAALNFFDLLMLVGKYQVRPQPPFTPGSEFSGTITEVGPSVTKYKIGDNIISAMTIGGLAQECIMHEDLVFPMPSSLNFVEAAGFGVGQMTAYHALVQRGNLLKGEYLLVTGAAGGMGVAAIQLGKALGAKVIAAVSSDEKAELCKKVGADFTINYGKEDMKDKVGKITNGHFVDVVYEVVGGDVFHQCVRCMAGGGRLLIVGFASGDIPKFAINLALVKGFSIVGVRSGEEMRRSEKITKEMMSALMKLVDSGHLKPYIHLTVPLSRAKEAYVAVADRKILGKAIVTMDEEAKL